MDTSLHFLSSPSVLQDTAHPLLVLLHGFGSDEKDLMGIRPYIDPKWGVVSIRAPFREGAGFRWYSLNPGPSQDNQEMEESIRALKGWFAQIPQQFPQASLDQLVISGFSQGAAMALMLGLFYSPYPPRGIGVLSGYLPEPPASLNLWRKIPVFWGHGMQDAVLPFQLAETGESQLVEHHLDVAFHSYPMGHAVIDEELGDFMQWLNHLTA